MTKIIELEKEIGRIKARNKLKTRNVWGCLINSNINDHFLFIVWKYMDIYCGVQQ